MAGLMPLLDLMRGEEDASRIVFPGARPVRELPGFGTASSAGTAGKRRRRRQHEPRPPQDWEEVFESQEPVVLRSAHSPTRWPSLTIASLGEAFPMTRAHVSPVPTVQMMSRVQPWGALPELEWRRPWTERNVSGAELFVDGASGVESDEHLYFMESLSNLPEQLRRALAPGVATLATPFQPVAEVNAWAGRPGVSSPLHYDGAHNVYAQLVGHKRFVLVPVEQSGLLHPFPRLHPSSRQSQINLRAVPQDDRYARFLAALGLAAGGGKLASASVSASASASASPAVEALRAYEVVLGPGDTLYIPP